MNTQGELSQEQLIQICKNIKLSRPQTIMDNQWVFFTQYGSMPFLWQAFIIEFTQKYIADMNYRLSLHTICSEIYQANQN